MRRFNKAALSLILILFISIQFIESPSYAGAAAVRNSVRIEQVKWGNVKEKADALNMIKTIDELASRKYEGRLAGSLGNKAAEKLVAGYFDGIGLDRPQGFDGYMQPYKQYVIKLSGKPEIQIIDKKGKVLKDLKYLKDFTGVQLNESSLKGEAFGEIYRIKDGTQWEELEELTGRVFLLDKEVYKKIGGARAVLNKNGLFPEGVGGVIIERDLDSSDVNHFMTYVNVFPYSRFRSSDGILVFFADSNAFRELKRASELKLSARVYKDSSMDYIDCSNVIGIIPGSDKNCKENIIISSHFDHIGSNGDGSYNPGALDNASGTAVMMEVARAIKANGIKPRKTITFIGFNGEEEGLYGSCYYADHPTTDLKNAVMINLDMVGCRANIPLTIEEFTKQGSSLGNDLSQIAKLFGIKTQKDVGNSSDHASLSFKGTQAVSLIEFEKNIYHSPKDTGDIIDKEHIKTIADMVLYYLDKNAF